MQTGVIRLFPIVIFLLVTFACLPYSILAQQSETSVACIEGDEPLLLNYGEYTVGCEIGETTDLDRFSFIGSDGDNIRIIVRQTSGLLDPRLEIWDPLGNKIINSYCYDGCTVQVNISLTDSGTYFMTVSDEVFDQTGNYTFQLEKIPPVYNPQDIPYDISVKDTINPVTDVDFFTFEGVEGTDVRIIVRQISGLLDPRLEIWDPLGNEIFNNYCYDACTVQSDLSLTISGTYLLFISDEVFDQTGDFQISAQCLFGDCESFVCSYLVSPTSEPFGSSGGTGSVSVTDVNDCGWKAISNDSWIKIDSGSSGTGQATVSYTVAEYTGTSSRTGTMTIAGKNFTVIQYPSINVIDGLVAYYPFNGNANDESANGNDGTVNGAIPTDDMLGNADSAYGFDGVDDYIISPDMSDSFSDETVTISVWFNAVSSGIIIDELGQNQLNGTFHDSQIEMLSTGEVKARVWSLPSVSLGIVDFGTWHHAVLRYDKATSNLDGFLDGEEILADVTGDRSAPYESGHGLYYAFGATDSTNLGSGTYFNGDIDDIRIYNRALLESEIQELYLESVGCGSISSTSEYFDDTGGVTGSVSVTADYSCYWTAISNDPDRITIESGSSGSGNGTVTYFVSENPYTTLRTSTITIAGTIFTVSQEGTGSTDDAAPSVTILFPEDGVTHSLLNIITGSSTDPPPSSGIVRVKIQVYDGTDYLGQDGKWYDSKQTITAEGAKSWSHDTDNVNWKDGATYTITATVYDNEGYEGTSTIEVPFSSDSGGQKYSTLDLELSSNAILQDETIDVSGKLTRLPDDETDISGNNINITITAPDGAVTPQSATTDSDGGYQIAGISGFNQKGTYTIQASFEETDTLAASSDEASLHVGPFAGYAIIVQGKISGDGNEGIESHNKTTNNIYNVLLERGFIKDNIYYFNYDDTQDVDDNGILDDIYNVPSETAIQNAITDLAKDKMNSTAAPLYIILHDHGSKDKFHMGDDELTPEKLDSWLDTLESGLDSNAKREKRIIIYGACYSGSFISALSKAPTDTDGGRVIVTSATEDEESYKGPEEPDGIRSGSYFLEEFFNELERGYSIKESFETATRKTETYTRTGGNSANTNNAYFDSSEQHPLLDDDGDGTGSNALSDGTGDGQIAADLYLGTGVTYDIDSASNPADVLFVTETVHLDHTTSTSLMWATANDNNQVESVWIEIRTPSHELSGEDGTEQLSTKYTKEPLDESSGKWEKQIDDFTESGMYEIYYFVQDDEGLETSPTTRSVVYKDKTGNNPPGIFDLKSPSYGSEQKTILIFEWKSSTDPDGDNVTYNLLIAEGPSFSNVVYREEEITTTAAIVDADAGLSDLTTYYWKVQAVDAYGLVTNSTQTWPFYTNNTNYGSGFIRGIVYNNNDYAPIVGATISIYEGSGVVFETVSRDGGYYSLEASAETYTVTCSYSDYSNGSISGIKVNSGKTTELNIPMPSSAPTGFTASASDSTLTLSWNAVSGADGYNVYYGYSSGNYAGSVDLGNTTSRTFSGIPDGTYYLAVTAYSGSEESDYSDEKSVTFSTNLSPPTGFTVSASDSTVTLSWNAVSGADGYNVYYGYSSGNYEGSVDLGNTTSRTFSGIPDGTYYLAATAYAGTEESSYSDEASVTVP